MNLFVDTSVWSLGLRRDVEPTAPQVRALRDALLGDEIVVTTGLILQELLQGFAGPTARSQIIKAFEALAFIQPDRQDHIDAADLRNTCRRAGVQLGTIDVARTTLRAAQTDPADDRQRLRPRGEALQAAALEVSPQSSDRGDGDRLR